MVDTRQRDLRDTEKKGEDPRLVDFATKEKKQMKWQERDAIMAEPEPCCRYRSV